jgi:hypothetical protein
MAILETALFSALAPAAVDAIKGIFGAASRKWLGLSVDDEIKLSSANIERLKALATLDNPYGTPSQWVIDLRGSFRYIACGIFVLGGISTLFVAPTLAPIGLEAAASASSFIFGERMLLSIKGGSK